MLIRTHTSIKSIEKSTWQQVINTDYPFIQWDFLAALEDSGALGADTGWQPQLLTVSEDEQLIAVMPLFSKQNSQGEFVFDHQWANAYYQHGFEYYPKLVAAIPYTPATGTRLFVADEAKRAACEQAVFTWLKQFISQQDYSSLHVLFPSYEESQRYEQQGLLTRKAVHFKWHNKNYTNFDDFLSTFASRKRKNIKKERSKVQQAGIEFDVLTGDTITANMWDSFYYFYQMTYLKRSGHAGYLSKAFFQNIGNTMADNLLLVMAKKEGVYIGGALNFKDSKNLYGRYWGCEQEYEFLHFDACYYQGIEYCIANALQGFDPGVQGEHKIQRGFDPVYTYSNHFIAQPDFNRAIAHFLKEEAKYVAEYKADAEKLMPYKKEANE